MTNGQIDLEAVLEIGKIKVTKKVGKREAIVEELYRKPLKGSLLPWLSMLSAVSQPELLSSSLQSKLHDWSCFPFEAFFELPPAYYKRLLENGAKPPHWTNADAPDLGRSGKNSNQELGLIGQQVYHLLNQQDATRMECGFELNLEARQNLKIVRIQLVDLENPPPFAFQGEWSDDSKDARSIKLTAVAALWHDRKLRRGAINWLKKGTDAPEFLLDYPPLAHFVLSLKGVARRVDSDKWTISLTVSIRIPHFLENGVVTAIPSLLTLKCPLARDWKCKRKGFQELELFFRKFENPPKNVSLLVASPHLRAAVEKLSELWADQSLRNILLIAPPGSGKEVLADFLHAGSVFFGQEKALTKDLAPKDKEKSLWAELHEWERAVTRIAGASLAGTKDIAVVRQILFGRVAKLEKRQWAFLKRLFRPQGSGELAIAVDVDSDLFWTGGLVLDARGTTVFLDEIDKCEPEIRAALLRFLENEEIHPVDSLRPLRLGDLEKSKPVESQQRKLKTRLLFAGSKSRKEILDSPPPDFWTRMHRIIEIPHPFEIPDTGERRRCIQEYVIFFLYRGVKDKLVDKVKRKADKKLNALKELLEAILSGEFNTKSVPIDKWAKALKTEVSKPNNYPFFYCSSKEMENISEAVASFLSRFSASTLSVRNLAAIIKQLDYRIELWVEQGIDLLATKDAPEIQGKKRDAARHLDRAWIWGNLHDITLSLLR